MILEELDDLSAEDLKPREMPQLQPKARTPRSFLDDGLPVSPDQGVKDTLILEQSASSLDEASNRILKKDGGDASASGKKRIARGGKKKRWLMGRGSAKRRKLEQNNALKEWLTSNGVWLSETADWGIAPSGVSIAVETREQVENEVSGRGLVARRKIDEFEDLAKVPLEACIYPESVRKEWGDLLPKELYSGMTPLALYLMNEKFNNPDSFWKPYLDILPEKDEIDAAVFWDPKELESLLDGSPIVNQSIAFRKSLTNEFLALKELVFDKDPERWPSSAFNLETWEWAYANIVSRSVKVKFQDMDEFLAMVPFVDLINHNPLTETNIKGVKEGYEVPLLREQDRYVRVKADKFYEEFEQIYVSYGDKSNAQLLMFYGFSLERNARDFMEINVEGMLDDDPLGEAKTRFLQSKGFLKKAYPLYRDRYTGEMMAFLRLLHVKQEDLRLPEEPTMNEILNELAELNLLRAWGELPERAAMLTLKVMCEELQSKYETTLEQDEDVINDRTTFELLPKRQRMALRVRFGEKMILQNTLNTIDTILNNVGRMTEQEEEDEKWREENSDNIWGRLGLKKKPAYGDINSVEDLMRELDI